MHTTHLFVNTSFTEILRTLGKNKWKVCIIITVILAFAVILAIALAKRKQNEPWPHNDEPCQTNNNTNAYTTFANRHILQGNVPADIQQWQNYLRNHGLCNRTRQTFFEQGDARDVELICDGNSERMPERTPSGRPNPGNLCISNATMLVHEVRVTDTTTCTIDNPETHRRYVIVACDRIVGVNLCRPVHFQGSEDQLPNGRRGTCRPAP